jgi:DNA-binding NtrC family response regulator/tetratricopeptide (TPR) repeat protein
MLSDASVHELISKGLFKDARKWIDNATSLSSGLRVANAQLEMHLGTRAKGNEMASKLLDERLSEEEKSSCWEVVGRACLSVGRIDDGLRAMAMALEAAGAAQDPRTEGRVRAQYAHSLLRWVGTEAAELELPHLRRAAVRAGDPMAMIAFHTLIAEINAQRGLELAATTSIETARGLLKSFNNFWQQGRLAIVSAGTAILQSDYANALAYTKEALTCADRSGSHDLTMPALGNLAFIKLAQGELSEAQTALEQLVLETLKSGKSIMEISTRDTEMQLALAEGDLDRASRLEQLITSLIQNAASKDSFYELWHIWTKVKWHYACGAIQAGLALATEAIPRITEIGDRHLLGRLRLIAAEGYSRIGEPLQAAALMSAAVQGNEDPSLELLAESYRVAGCLTAADDLGTALGHFERANRILKGIGNITASAEVERLIGNLLEPAEMPRNISVNPSGRQEFAATEFVSRPADSRVPAAPLVERIAALIELGSHSSLLAAETLSLIRDTGAVVQAAIVTTNDRGDKRLEDEFSLSGIDDGSENGAGLVQIPLGWHRDRHYELVVLPFPTASAHSTLLSLQRLVSSSRALARARQLEREQGAVLPTQAPEQELGLICSSERMIGLINVIRRVASSNVNVLLTGETGVGKELFARALHHASHRKDRPFLPFNCSTVPRDLIDSQLFGHRRGAFTGALDASAGTIRAAANGTLFLDEIGDMSLDAQPKLLRFLESGEILPLGESKPQHVDVRIVAATNAKLDQLVREGRFREDLYYRLDVIKIHIPPLRERREEIPALVDHFLDKFCQEFQKPRPRVAEETLEYLVLYRWPGNVRQLSNEIQRVVAMAEPFGVLMPAHLSDDIVASRRTVPVETPSRTTTEVVTRIDQPLAAAVEHIERAAIQRALSMTLGRLDEAAKMLGLSRKGLYLKRQRLGL